MADFTDSMTAFIDRLKTSIDDRGESLARVHQATTDLLDGARDFLENVAAEHQARAENIHTFLSDSRANLSESVETMRKNHCDSLLAMREEMHHVLDEARQSRVEEVKVLLADSRRDRCETSTAMMKSHRDSLAAMREGLHKTLEEANKGRLEAVDMMRETFQATRHGLATDLRDSAKAWKQFSSRKAAPHVVSSKPATIKHVEVKASKPAPMTKAPVVESPTPTRGVKASDARKAKSMKPNAAEPAKPSRKHQPAPKRAATRPH